MPILPGDALLVGGGILIAAGGVPWPVYLAGTTGCMVIGALGCFAWAGRAGPPALAVVGRRLRSEGLLTRGTEKLRRSGWVGVFALRMIPGMRVYTTMIAGCARMPLRTYLGGLLPAVLAWVVGFGVLGVVAGRPMLHVVARMERMAAIGALLLALALLFVVAARAIPAPGVGRRRSWRVAPWHTGAACLLDLTAITLVALGVREILVGVCRVPGMGLVPTAILAAAVVLGYLAAARRSVGRTPGETVLRVSYRGPLFAPPAVGSADS